MARAKRSSTKSKSHRDVEFAVELANGDTKYLKTFNEAAGLAVAVAASNGKGIKIDVLISSVSGARWWGGDYAVEEYRSDPDASVSQRIVVKADDQGRVY